MSWLDDDEYLAEILEALKQRVEGGDKAALLPAIFYCFQLNKPVPDWLRQAFLHAYDAATSYEFKSWDDIFGPLSPKGAHLKTKRRNLKLRVRIIERVQQLKASGDPVDKGLFEKIGREFKIKGGTASDLYYDKFSREFREIQKMIKFTPEKK